MISSKVEPMETLRLFDLVDICRSSASSDHRDKIFACIGLATDADQFPKPNYSSNIAKVYYDFAKVFVAQGYGLEVVMRAGVRQLDHLMASWVPDLAIRYNYKWPGHYDTGISIFSAGLGMAPQVALDDSEEALLVKCKVFSSIIDMNSKWNLRLR